MRQEDLIVVLGPSATGEAGVDDLQLTVWWRRADTPWPGCFMSVRVEGVTGESYCSGSNC